jgi:hypothetical protein
VDFQLQDAIPILEQTPALLASLLRDRPDEWLNGNEGEDTFSPIEVVGHLIYGEQTDWIPRGEIILRDGASRTFDPFDRWGFRAIVEQHSFEELLALFAELRARNLDTLRSWNLDEAKLDLIGTHPALGPVTMRNLLAMWVVHDLKHLEQIARVLSKQYTTAIGPWASMK